MVVVVVVLLVEYTDCPSCVRVRALSFSVGLYKTNKLSSVRKEIEKGGKRRSYGCCNADRKSNHLFVPN